MAQIASLLRRSAPGLGFGDTDTGREAAERLTELPSLPAARRALTLLSILLDLAGETDPKILSTNQVRPICRVEDQQRIDAICLYLNRHFREEINFAELTRQVHMDHTSLCRFFRRATGRTMTAYVNEIRVGAAAQLLADTDQSILAIGFEVGFGNYSNFNRQFKRIKGYTPRMLRRQF
jgi:AraC-like DNA-binding protein